MWGDHSSTRLVRISRSTRTISSTPGLRTLTTTSRPSVSRAALDAAFGLTDEVAPEHYRIAMAALDLVSEVATDAPLLLVAEDAQWLDRPTSEVLAFIARRIESDPIILLVATRDGYPSVLGGAGLPEHRLGGLDDATARALLDAVVPKLSLAARTRVLREATGNPLALLELPAVAGGHEDEPWVSGGLPLTERLERAFATRVSELPEETRLLLLVAALNDSDSLSEILRAGSLIAGTTLDLDLLVPAAEAAIVELDLLTLRFRHPLIRSAVRQSASAPQRRRVHEALAETLEAEPDRRVWHRAALITEGHEDVALELEEAGRRALRRGALYAAITVLRRAAELGDPARRGRRFLSAGDLAVELGQPELAATLLREAGEQDGPVERALATRIEEMINPPDLGDAERVARVADAQPSVRETRAIATCTSGFCGWRSPERGGPIPDRLLVASSLTPLAASAARAIGTRACLPSTPAPIRSATRPRPCPGCRPWRPRGCWMQSPCGTWDRRHSSSAPLTSLLACSRPPPIVRASRGGWDNCLDCLCSTASSPRSSAHGTSPFPPARRRGGWRRSSAGRSGSREARPSSPWSPGCEATPTRPSAAPPAPSSWAWPPAAGSPSPWLSSAACSARWERTGTTTHTRRPGGCSTRLIRRTTRSWLAGSSPTSRRPPSTPTASPRRESYWRRWRPRRVRDRRSGSS